MRPFWKALNSEKPCSVSTAAPSSQMFLRGSETSTGEKKVSPVSAEFKIHPRERLHAVTISPLEWLRDRDSDSRAPDSPGLRIFQERRLPAGSRKDRHWVELGQRFRWNQGQRETSFLCRMSAASYSYVEVAEDTKKADMGDFQDWLWIIINCLNLSGCNWMKLKFSLVVSTAGW